MNKALTVTQEIPILLECDVLVVGAGISGFAAAVSASRAGADVVLAEKNHFPGGVATSGLMCSISNYFVTRDGTQITTGLPIEFIDRLVSEGGTMADYLRPTQPQIPNNPEVVKRVMIEMLRESKVKTLPTSLENTIRNWRDYGVFHLPHGGGDAIGVVKQALENGDYPDHFGTHATNIACFGLFAARCNNGTVLINSNWFHGDCYDVIAESEREEEGRLLEMG